MSVESILGGIALAFFKLIVGLVLSIGSIYTGIWLLDRLTPNIDEWKEIKKGNFAVGVLLGGIVLSIAIIIEGAVNYALSTIVPSYAFQLMAALLFVAVLKLVIALVAAIISVYIALRVLDSMTMDINEMSELKKGNIAVATVMATVMIAVAFVIKSSVDLVLASIDLSPILHFLGA